MKAMILAAGEGTRLRPLTEDRPKPMLDVAGRPLLEHTIAWLRHYGFTEIAINLHYRPDIVINHFGDGAAFGINITYSLEEEPLGTAGGVKRIVGFFDAPFVLVYGDVLTDLDLKALVDFHFAQPVEPHVSMSLYHVPNPWECGIVDLNAQGRVTRFVEKPPREDLFSHLASAGVVIIDPAVLEYVPENTVYDFGRDLFPKLLRLGTPLYGWPLPDTTYLVDIGTPEKYNKVQQEWPTSEAHAFLERIWEH